MAQDNFFDQFEDAPDEQFFNQFEDDVPVAPTPERGIVGRAWDALNKPLVDLAPAASRAANYIDTPELDDSSFTARLKGFGAGAIQGLGDVVSGLTSPLELGLAAASGGSSLAAKRGLSGVAKGLAATEGLLGAAESGHGIGEIYGGAKEGNLARVGMGIVETAGGGAGMKQGFDGFTAKPKPEIPPAKTLTDDVDEWIDTEIDAGLNQPVKPLVDTPIPESITPEELVKLYRGYNPELGPGQNAVDPASPGNHWYTPNIETAKRYADKEYNFGKGQVGVIEVPRSRLSEFDRTDMIESELPDANGMYQEVRNPHEKYQIPDELHKGWKVVDPTELEGLADRATNPRVLATNAVPPSKPKIKVKLNPETNSLEPDLSDEVTAKVFESAKTGEPIPHGQRLNPDDEIDLEDLNQGAFEFARPQSDNTPMTKYASEAPDKATALASADARQLEMKDARTNDTFPEADGKRPNPVTAKKMAQASQGELPGGIREAAPDVMVPGGRPMKPREITKTQEWLGLPRAIQSAFDLSFPLRQGLGLIHTKGWWKAWPDMIKSFGSDATYQGVMDSIAARPNFSGREITLRNGKKVVEQSLAQKAGLAITDLTSHREEELGSALAGSIPGIGKGIKASNRAYNAFANKVRADAFDALIAQNPEAKTNIVLAKQLADFVNNASGRGKLPGQWEGAAAALNNTLFSPRLMASRLQMLNPKNYLFTRPEVRKEYLKSMLFTAGTWGILAGLAKAGGAEVVMDPESTDFGKIKIGNTRMDPAGGFQQYLVLATRLAKGGLDKATQAPDRRYSGKAFAPTPQGDLWNFIENKFAPNTRLATGPWTANKNQPFELADQTMRTFTPIMIQDISEIMQENPELAWTLLPGLVGVGTNTYKAGKQSPTLLPKSIWNRKKDITFR